MKKLSSLLLAVLLIGCGGGGGGGGDNNGTGSTPVVTTLPASSITPSSVILNGMAIPNGLQTLSWFEYGVDSALATYTSSPKQDAGNGLAIHAANMTWNGLTAGTPHYFRFCAENSKGYSKGLIFSVTTASPGNPPTVDTLSATSIAATSATLNGNVSPNGMSTDAWFEWGTDSTLTSFSSTSAESVGYGTTSQSVNAGLTGMATGTTYYYRVAAANSAGTTKGSILSFTPGAAPGVTTLAATSVGANAATLNGNVMPNGMATNAWFEWGADSTLASFSSTPTESAGSGTTGLSVNAALAGLSPGTTYYYRVAAGNSSGTTKGSVLSLTPGAPTVTTLAANSVGATGATLNGNVTPNGMATNAWFEWGTNSALSSFSSTPAQSVGSGTASQSINAALTGLTAGTTYYYRVNAANSAGMSTGAILGFSITSHQITTWPDNRKGAVSLGFDDGCPSHLSLAVPALNARGFKGTFFVVSGDGSWSPDWDEWRNVAAQGHEIGSHTKTHPWLTRIPLAQAQDEMAGAKAIIDAEIPTQKCLTFVYPFGDLNSSIKSYAQSLYIGAKGISCGLNSEPFDFGNMKACSPDDQGDVFVQADAAEAQGKWVDAFFHTVNAGADGCYGVWGYGQWTSFLDHLMTKDLYVGTFGSLVKYSKQRLNATLSVLSSSADNIVLSLTDTLDDAIYNQPLTIRSVVPSGWDNVEVQQGSSIMEVQSHLEGSTRVIIYNAVPDRGLITLRSPQGG